MEIIKLGKIPEEIEHFATCNNCKTEFKFLQGEAERVSDRRNESYLRIMCPVCSYNVTTQL